jgi:hypothetical protein
MRRNKPNIITYYCSNQNGASLVFVLLASFILISLATIVVRFSNTDIQSTLKQENQINAYYIAEAGFEDVLYKINNKELVILDITELSLPSINFQNGTYDVTITKKDKNSNNEEIGYLITSIGRYNGEKRTLTAWVKEKLWDPENEDETPPDALSVAMYSETELIINMKSILSLGSNGHIFVGEGMHANKLININHESVLLDDGSLLGGLLGGIGLDLFDPPTPVINGRVSTHVGPIVGTSGTYLLEDVPIPQFDFDRARQKAQDEGVYVRPKLGSDGKPKTTDITKINLSLLGKQNEKKFIFIDGPLEINGVSATVLDVSNELEEGQGLTLIVNGPITINGVFATVGESKIPLNLIAKKDIRFSGLNVEVGKGTEYHGIIFSQGKIENKTYPMKVKGYVGANKLEFKSSVLENVLSLFGNYSFIYNKDVFKSLPPGIGFKQNVVEVIEQKESADDDEE